MAGLHAALARFTRLPVATRKGHEGHALELAWLPLIGVLVAAIGTGIRAATLPLLGGLPSAVLTVTAAVAVTGAFHEDGLADTVDAAWGGWNRQRRLEILRDSRLGTYGTAALSLSLLLRVALLAPLSPVGTGTALLAAEVLGRATSLPLVAALPPARDDGQLADVPAPARSGWLPWAATTLVAAAGLGRWGPAAIAAAALGAAGVGRLAWTRFGGVTGDLLGAANQAAHLLVLAVVVAGGGGA